MDILFVCTGNTCRSAMAEWLMKKALYEQGVKGLKVCSCGTNTMPSYKVPAPVISLMAKEGIDISGHKAMQITGQIADASDLILAMAKEHKDYIDFYFPNAKSKTHLLKELTEMEGGGDVMDPIGQKDEVYLKTAEELKACVNNLVRMLIKENKIK